MGWLPKKKVIVPFDFSENSLAAVDTALQMVADPSHVHHVSRAEAPIEQRIRVHRARHDQSVGVLGSRVIVGVFECEKKKYKIDIK